MTHKEYVIAHWEWVNWFSDQYEHGTYLVIGGKKFDFKNSVGNPELYLTPFVEAKIWANAYQYTLEREEQIRLKRQEIAFLNGAKQQNQMLNTFPMERILAILESQLNDLLKGFKE